MVSQALPLVSLIVPMYNRAALLPFTLQSIADQTYMHWECIIVDDGSTENNLELAQAFANIDARFQVHARPAGLTKGGNNCRNYGFQLAKGTLINWFDSDDIMHPEMLRQKVTEYERTKADIVICRQSFFKGSIAHAKPDHRQSIGPQTGNPPFEYFRYNFWFGTSQPLFSRSLFSNFEPFNPILTRNQETECFVKILLQDPFMTFIEEPLIFMRLHEDSIGAKHHALSEGTKLARDLPAYASMFGAFTTTKYFTPEVKTYFQDFFYRCLRKMDVDHPDFYLSLRMCLRSGAGTSSWRNWRLYVSRRLRYLLQR